MAGGRGDRELYDGRIKSQNVAGGRRYRGQYGGSNV